MKIFMTRQEKFETLLAFGEEGEKIVGELLLQEGWFVQPLYQYKKDKTPYIFYYDGMVYKIIAPDISAIKEGQLTFVECKRKNSWVKNWRNDGSLETGIDNRLLNSYLKTFDLTKVPVELYFVQETEEPLGVYRLKINKDTRDLFRQLPDNRPDYRRISYMKIEGHEVCMSFFSITDLEKIK